MDKIVNLKPAFEFNNVAVITSTGENFSPYVGVLLQSIIENASDTNNYDFIVLHDGLSRKTEKDLINIALRKNNVSVRFVDVSNMLEGYDFKSVASYVPALTCARLLIPEVFQEYKKAIWIDADIVVDRDIADLYNTDISNYLIAAVPEIGMPYFHEKKGHFMIHILDDILKMSPYEYFNGGVQVLNCESLRKLYSAEYALKTAARKDFKFLDQDAMNFLCKSQSLLLDGRWNVRAKFDDLIENGPQEIVSRYREYQQTPYIIHFVGPYKPGENPDVEMNEYFWKYAEKTIYNRSFWKKYKAERKKGENTCVSKKNIDLVKKIKMKLLPPSSQSFWSVANLESQNFKALDDKLRKTENDFKAHYTILKDKIEALEIEKEYERNKVIFRPKEDKVRIVFLFQIASFWPNWESFYEACKQDERFDVKLLYLSDVVIEKFQIKTAQDFLDKTKLEYEPYSEDILYHFNPHVIVMQSPYDNLHRLPEHQSDFFKRHGYRIVYIPYGIELSDTMHARKDHFENPVVRNAWRIYTFSERMKQEYFYRTANKQNVKALGHPKFDSLIKKDSYTLEPEVRNKISERKIVLWHLHFPKIIVENGKKVMCTPMLQEYYEFLRYIKENEEIFFLMLPHPKFIETSEGIEFIEACKAIDNIYIDWSDDYRPALYAADFMITDRSAMMIEVAPTGIPVLYMTNQEYYEPLTAAIKPLMDAYYQGNSYMDMRRFVEMCKRGEDPEKEKRLKAIKNTLPRCIGDFGEKIKEDIYNGLDIEFRQYIDHTNMFRLRKAIDDRMNVQEMRMRREVRGGFYNLTWELKKNNILPTSNTNYASEYDNEFYDTNRYNSLLSATKILRKLMPCLDVKSAVDFGCGTGTWLYVLQKFGVTTVLGIDGDYVNRDYLMIDASSFQAANLEEPLILNQKFDLAISVEVAEHLHEEAADTFVTSLCGAADIILFSAAHPGQGGTNHFNEQPFGYWKEKFERKGFESIEIRQFFENDMDIGYEYRTNITIYVKKNLFDELNKKIK